ncbi:hypothetical protein [Shewanella sp. cp20]|uniref:hypothetical protein n=1 Tax=Shewanella sp. cp20 TaxID=1521167 RepID=UPI001269ECC6|nr:hypothetical protein [Shewanella sp. cp20]
MLSEKEFNILHQLKNKSVLSKSDFKDTSEFDYSCELAQGLLNKGVIHTKAQEPFQMNYTGDGSKYQAAGRFLLSTQALDIVSSHKNYNSYVSSIPKPTLFNIDRRIALISLIVAVISLYFAAGL